MTERIAETKRVDAYLQKELQVVLSSEAEFDQFVKERYDVYFAQKGDATLREYFLTTLVPKIKEIYGQAYLKAARRVLRILENGSNLPAEQVAEYFKNRAVSSEELEFARLPVDERERMRRDTIQAVSNAIGELRRRYGEDVRLVDAVILYGSFADGTFTYKSDLNVLYITASGDKKETSDNEYVDASAELSRLLQVKTGKQIDEFIGPFDITRPEELLEHRKDDGLLSGTCIVVSPNQPLKKQLEELLHLST